MYGRLCHRSQTLSCETYLKKIATTRKLSELSKTEQNRLATLDELRRAENVQNRRLATWLTEVEYESFESDWESQLQIREELNDKPDELKRYADKLKNAVFSIAERKATAQKENTAQLRNFTIAVRATAKIRWKYCKR